MTHNIELTLWFRKACNRERFLVIKPCSVKGQVCLFVCFAGLLVGWLFGWLVLFLKCSNEYVIQIVFIKGKIHPKTRY